MIFPRYLALLAICSVLVHGLGAVSIGGIVPEFLLIIALYPTMTHGFRLGYVFAWLAGLAVDLQSLGAGVPYCLSYLAAAYAVSLAGSVLEFRQNAIMQALAVGGAALAVGNLSAIMLRLGDGSHATPLLATSVLTALYTAVTAPLVCAVLDRLPFSRRPIAALRIPIGATSAARSRKTWETA